MEAAPLSTNGESGADANAPATEPTAAIQASAPELRIEAQDAAAETQTGRTESGTISVDESLRLAAEIAAEAALELAASNPTVAP